MPRIYATNEQHSMAWGEVDFAKGVAAMAASADTSYFEDAGYTIDSSKHVLTVLDELEPAQLRRMCAYLGLTIDAGDDPDTKHTLIRAIEGSISTKYIAAVTVASTAGTEVGDSDIAITGEGTYKYKTAATTAPALLYLDYPDATWLDIETGDDITPAAGHDKITVVKLNEAGYVIGIGSDDITVNAG
jgi:hypothetical protein